MDSDTGKTYDHIHAGGAGFYEQPRGLIAVWGKEAVPFLDGMLTNNVKKLADGDQMLAAFPSAQGRLIAVVRVLRQGDRYLFETEKATRGKVFQNLSRFTLAGDFFVEDLSDQFRYFEIFAAHAHLAAYDSYVNEKVPGAITYEPPPRTGWFVPVDLADGFWRHLSDGSAAVSISDDLYELLRIESGIPKYGFDMDEMTIVPELGLEGMIAYNKGCYVGQEIIARIHFRGHVAKQLTGLVSEAPLPAGAELEVEGKNAGRITSTAFSPKLERNISLGFVRYDYLTPGTHASVAGRTVTVSELPFLRIG